MYKERKCKTIICFSQSGQPTKTKVHVSLIGSKSEHPDCFSVSCVMDWWPDQSVDHIRCNKLQPTPNPS